MFTTKHYNYLVDTITNDPDISPYLSNITCILLGIYFQRDMENFNMPRWLKVCGVSEEAFKEIVENDTSHSTEIRTARRNQAVKS